MSNPPVSGRDVEVQVLSLEYQTLRDEVLTRLSSRYQFLGFTTAAAALLATGSGNLVSGPREWLLPVLAGVIFVLGIGWFWYAGTIIVVLSKRIAEIENRINDIVPADPPLLSWESSHQRRTLVDRWVYGYRPRTSRITGTQTDKSRPSDP